MSEIELLKGVRVFDVSQGMAQGKNNQVKLILSLSFIPYALRPMPYASSAGNAMATLTPARRGLGLP